jgi:adenosyl cobinamide kinase/adenosyl cobinamide phosphate guanylyltransferase
LRLTHEKPLLADLACGRHATIRLLTVARSGEVLALAEEAGVECEELIVFGRPEQTILSVSEEVGADPIFLGAEGTTGLEHAALIGSVSEEALRHANRTVLVVGGHPEDGSASGENAGAER